MSFQLVNDECVIRKIKCSRFAQFGTVGGELTITNLRLIFVESLSQKEIIIPINDIIFYDKIQMGNLFAKVIVKSKDTNIEYYLNKSDGDSVFSFLNENVTINNQNINAIDNQNIQNNNQINKKKMSKTKKILIGIGAVYLILMLIGMFTDSEVIESDNETGYAFDMTIDDFIDNYNNSDFGRNGKINKKYWESSSDEDMVGNCYRKDIGDDFIEYSYMTSPFGIYYISLKVDNQGKIFRATALVDNDFINDTSISDIITILNCASGIKEKTLKTNLEKQGPYFEDNIVYGTKIDGSEIGMSGCTVVACSKEWYKNNK